MASLETNKKISIFYLIVAGLSIVYDIVLLILTPGTLLDNLTSFTNIWLVFAIFLIIFAVFRLKTGHSLWYNCKNWIRIPFVSLLGIGVIFSIVSLIFIYNPKVIDEKIDYVDPDYLIILGGGIDKDGNLPTNVQRRIEESAKYLKKHRNTICVVTGGKLKWLPYAEAPEMKRQLMLKGIESNRILVEDEALDTIQNFKNSCQLLANYEGVQKENILRRNIVVVTSYFHLRRAERLANRLGFKKISGIGTHCTPITALHLYVREIAAYAKLNLRILFTGEPKKLVTPRK